VTYEVPASIKLAASAITIGAQCGGKFHRIGWVSLQADGAISVGLSDSALILRDFEAKAFLWNAFNRTTVEFYVPHDPTASRRVYGPHMTFHPPGWLHLTEQKGGASKRSPFQAITDIALMVRQQGVVPWIRFTSKPVGKIDGAVKNAGRQAIEIAADAASSICLSVDFVPANDAIVDAELGVAEWVDHGAYRLRVSLAETTGQPASIGWIHQS
jgi:hypothetical protein